MDNGLVSYANTIGGSVVDWLLFAIRAAILDFSRIAALLLFVGYGFNLVRPGAAHKSVD